MKGQFGPMSPLGPRVPIAPSVPLSPRSFYGTPGPQKQSSLGRFSLLEFLGLVLIVPIILVLVMFGVGISYDFTIQAQTATGLTNTVVTDGIFEFGVAWNDIALIFYALTSLGTVFLALSLPADRDNAFFMVLLLLFYTWIIYMAQDAIVSVMAVLISNITALPTGNLTEVSVALKVLPIISFIVSVILMFVRTDNKEVKG